MSAPKPPVVAIVDAYSSGHWLPHWFRSNGHDCVHVSSSQFVEEQRSFNPNDFCALLQHRGDTELTITQLRELKPAAIVAGSETGVLLADRLAASISGVPSNGIRRSPARRDKSAMNAVLRERGLPAVQERHVRTPSEGIEWAISLNRWPVVAKPCASAGGDSVVVCYNPDELRYSLQAIIGGINKIGVPNEGALVQEFVEGEIYSVNTVSCQGTHYVTNIWRYEKQGLLYDHEYLIPRNGRTQAILVSYAFKVLDALEISYGPAHIEIIYRPGAPVVVDFGARLHGCDSPVINRECTGIGQDELTADAYVNPTQFFNKTKQPYVIYKHLMTVDFICPIEGYLRSLDGFNQLRGLESYHLLRLDIEAGGQLQRTIDLFTSPGLVELVHRNFDQLQNDLTVIRKLEASTLYRI